MSEGVPFYDLYGESLLRERLEFVHVEDIAHRSRGLDWKIKPHRHDKLTQIICTFDNSWQADLDDEHYKLDGNCLVLIPPGVVHSFAFRANVRGYVLSLNQGLLFEALEPRQNVALLDLVSMPQVVEFKDHEQIQRFTTYIGLLVDEIRSVGPDQQFVLARLVQLILSTIRRQQAFANLNDASCALRSSMLLDFRRLIEQHYREHHSVKQYAQQLHVSVSTLNRLCKTTLKVSPKVFIHQRLIDEAKRKLLYTKQNIEDIAYSLGFKDVAYFSRFFKQATGETAGQFRKIRGY